MKFERSTTPHRLVLLQLRKRWIILTRHTVPTLPTSFFWLWLGIHMLLSRLAFLEDPGVEAYLGLQEREGRASSQSQSLVFHPAEVLEQQGTWKIWWCHQQTCFGLRGQLNLDCIWGTWLSVVDWHMLRADTVLANLFKARPCIVSDLIYIRWAL